MLWSIQYRTHYVRLVIQRKRSYRNSFAVSLQFKPYIQLNWKLEFRRNLQSYYFVYV